MKLTLSHIEQDALQNILGSYDHLCDCPDWPNCDDFKLFTRLKKRIANLPEKSRNGVSGGVLGNMRMRKKLIERGTAI